MKYRTGITKLDIDNTEQLELTAEAKERAKKDAEISALLKSMNGLQGKLLQVLLQDGPTPAAAKGALESIVKMYESLPYNLRG